MYRFLILFILLAIAFTVSSDARDSHDEFSYNIQDVSEHLAPLTKIEQLHISHPDKSFDQLIEDHDMAHYKFAEFSSSINGLNEPMPVLPAFWWGCILGWVGLLIVFLVTQDSAQTKSALWGCIVSGLLGCTIYAIMILAIGTSSAYYWWFW